MVIIGMASTDFEPFTIFAPPTMDKESADGISSSHETYQAETYIAEMTGPSWRRLCRRRGKNIV